MREVPKSSDDSIFTGEKPYNIVGHNVWTQFEKLKCI